MATFLEISLELAGGVLERGLGWGDWNCIMMCGLRSSAVDEALLALPVTPVNLAPFQKTRAFCRIAHVCLARWAARQRRPARQRVTCALRARCRRASARLRVASVVQGMCRRRQE